MTIRRHPTGYPGGWGYQEHDTDGAGGSGDGEADNVLLASPTDGFPFLHLGARYYDPALGRFLQRDPIGIRGGLNVYGYVGNQPATLVDPTGYYKHKSFRLSNTGRLRYGLSRPRGAPPGTKRLALRYGNKLHIWGWQGVAATGLLCLTAAEIGYTTGRAIDDAVGQANNGFGISDGLADIIFNWVNDNPGYDPWGS